MIKSDSKPSAGKIPSHKKDTATAARSRKAAHVVLQKSQAKYAMARQATEKKELPKRAGSRWSGW